MKWGVSNEMVWMQWRTQKSIDPASNLTLTHPVSSPQRSHYTDWAIHISHANEN